MSEGEGEWGQEPPPLIVYLKQILAKYPEGSQVSELLQNADDAGATRVRFVLDMRSRSHGGSGKVRVSSS